MGLKSYRPLTPTLRYKQLNDKKEITADKPYKPLAVAGSLLGISLHNGVSFPVGKVDELDVLPMSFGEFLLAKGEAEAYRLLENHDFDVILPLHEKFVDLLRQYYYVGGMPEAVLNYVETGALQEVRRIQQTILRGYNQDFSKHAPKEQVPRIRMVWQSVPFQLCKENKKFIYGALRKGARANDFEFAIQWLLDAGLLYKVPRCNKLELPLAIYEDLSAFKLFLLDCGLLGCMAEAPAGEMLVGDNVFREFKGAFTEQYVLQQLVAQGLSPYYWSSERTPAEIDFVVQTARRVVPVEVKAEENVRARAMAEYVRTHADYALKGLRISMKGYQDQEWMENIPLFALTKWIGGQER